MDDLALNSVSGLYDLKAVGFGNYDGTTFNYYGAVNGENSRIYTQELRLTSSFDAPVNFMLGGYYEHSKRESFTVGRGGFGLPVPFDPAIGNSSVGYWPDDFVYKIGRASCRERVWQYV